MMAKENLEHLRAIFDFVAVVVADVAVVAVVVAAGVAVIAAVW